jgi:preprotein translocase subunit SecG
MQQLITILHILIAVSIIVLVLLQHGKGADIGATFGSGSSNTMFGSQGTTPFLVKLTASLAFIFFITCVTLSYFSFGQVKSNQMNNPLPMGVPTQHLPVAPSSPNVPPTSFKLPANSSGNIPQNK